MQSPTVLTTLLILLVGLALARISAGKLARWAVPAIVVELLIGFGLGNSVLPFEAIKPLSGLTELGVLALFFQVGLEVRGDLLLSRRGTILRLVALSCLAPLLGYWPLTLGFGMAPATALCSAWPAWPPRARGSPCSSWPNGAPCTPPRAGYWWGSPSLMTCPPSAC